MAGLALNRDFDDTPQPLTDQKGCTAPEFTDAQTAALRAAHIDRLALRLLKGEPVSTFTPAEIAEALRTAIITAAPGPRRKRNRRSLASLSAAASSR